MEVIADSDNFDFDSNGVVNLTANKIHGQAFDPYNLMPATGSNGRLEIVYTDLEGAIQAMGSEVA